MAARVKLTVSENEAATIAEGLRLLAYKFRYDPPRSKAWIARADEVDELARRIAEKAGLE